MIDGKGFEGNILGLIELTSRHLLVKTEERRENFSQDSQCVSAEIRTGNLQNM
jgi:hypothetical protein